MLRAGWSWLERRVDIAKAVNSSPIPLTVKVGLSGFFILYYALTDFFEEDCEAIRTPDFSWNRIARGSRSGRGCYAGRLFSVDPVSADIENGPPDGRPAGLTDPDPGFPVLSDPSEESAPFIAGRPTADRSSRHGERRGELISAVI